MNTNDCLRDNGNKEQKKYDKRIHVIFPSGNNFHLVKPSMQSSEFGVIKTDFVELCSKQIHSKNSEGVVHWLLKESFSPEHIVPIGFIANLLYRVGIATSVANSLVVMLKSVNRKIKELPQIEWFHDAQLLLIDLLEDEQRRGILHQEKKEDEEFDEKPEQLKIPIIYKKIRKCEKQNERISDLLTALVFDVNKLYENNAYLGEQFESFLQQTTTEE